MEDAIEYEPNSTRGGRWSGSDDFKAEYSEHREMVPAPPEDELIIRCG